MQDPESRSKKGHWTPKETARAYVRGMAGGLLVAMPLLATMEMWWLGFYMPPTKMLLFLVVNFFILLILEYYSGFRRYEQVNLYEEARDAVSAYGIGFFVAAAALWALRLIRPEMAPQEVIGKIVLQSIPISIGASVSISQLGRRNPPATQRKEEAGFWGTQAMALAGALFFGFNIAPTIEPMLLGLQMHWWNGLIILALSILQVHAVVYYVDFRGSIDSALEALSSRRLWTGSLTTCALSLLMAAYLLWTFGRMGAATGPAAALHMTIALGFVTSLGAAAGKLIL